MIKLLKPKTEKPAPPKEESLEKHKVQARKEKKTRKNLKLKKKHPKTTEEPADKKPKKNIDLHIVGKIDLKELQRKAKQLNRTKKEIVEERPVPKGRKD